MDPKKEKVLRWPVFICYRQIDGTVVASWLARRLRQVSLFVNDDNQTEKRLEVYFDQETAAISDWTQDHRPALERAKAFLIICTPGAHSVLKGTDWVHEEIGWWLTNRTTAPILIDATGESDRWVPNKVHDQWPSAQCVPVLIDKWKNLKAEERDIQEKVVTDRIVAGIERSGNNRIFEDVAERERLLRVARDRARQRTLALSIVFAVTIVAFLAFFRIFQLSSENKIAKQDIIAAEAKSDAAETRAELKRLRSAINVKWTSSPIYKALVEQSFAWATERLDEALQDRTQNAIHGGNIDLPPAVILDIDDTVLSSLPYLAREFLDGGYLPSLWNDWLKESTADPVPGSLAFCTHAQINGVKIFYISNRKQHLEGATRRNLERHGFPVSQNALLLRDSSSDKSDRRQNVLRRHQVLLQIGSALSDFGPYSRELVKRERFVVNNKALWGRDWIVIPQASHGPWTSSFSEETRDDVEYLKRLAKRPLQ